MSNPVAKMHGRSAGQAAKAVPETEWYSNRIKARGDRAVLGWTIGGPYQVNRALVLIEAGSGGPNPNVPADIGRWLDSWPTSFPSRETAATFLGRGPVGAGWAAGLEKRQAGWWPRFDPDMMVRSLTEIAQHSYRHEWGRVTCPTLVGLVQNSFMPRRKPTTCSGNAPTSWP